MRLGPSDIALWTIPIQGLGAREVLSAAEQAWADAAIDAEARRRRVCARSALRRVLAAYLETAPADLDISADAHGKPRVANGPAFNLSHSEDLMLLAVGDVAEVGVDLERCGRLQADWRSISRAAFSTSEQAELEATPQVLQPDAALRAWVRKEAYAKARGVGFAYGFKTFTVRINEGAGGSSLVEDLNDPAACANWRVTDVAAPPGFIASLAYLGPPANIHPRAMSEIER